MKKHIKDLGDYLSTLATDDERISTFIKFQNMFLEDHRYNADDSRRLQKEIQIPFMQLVWQCQSKPVFTWKDVYGMTLLMNLVVMEGG